MVGPQREALHQPGAVGEGTAAREDVSEPAATEPAAGAAPEVAGEPANAEPAADAAEEAEAAGAAAAPQALGACARRRLRKEQLRDERKPGVREQRREKRQRQKQNRRDAQQERLAAMDAEERAAFWTQRSEEGRERKATHLAVLQQAFDSGRPRVVVNCSFGAAMNHKELSSLAKQVQLSYTAVRDLGSSIQLHLTSVSAENPALRSFEAIGFRSWLLHVHEDPYWEAFAGQRLVVLSPDAEEDLEEVEEDCTYVIGGLVDRSVSKMQSVGQARAHDVASLRKLPIKRYGPVGAHPVLNIDVVVRILAEWLHRKGDWPGILSDCLPYRKSGQPTARTRRKQKAQERRAAQQGAGDLDNPASDAASDTSGSESSSEDEA